MHGDELHRISPLSRAMTAIVFAGVALVAYTYGVQQGIVQESAAHQSQYATAFRPSALVQKQSPVKEDYIEVRYFEETLPLAVRRPTTSSTLIWQQGDTRDIFGFPVLLDTAKRSRALVMLVEYLDPQVVLSDVSIVHSSQGDQHTYTLYAREDGVFLVYEVSTVVKDDQEVIIGVRREA